MMMIISITIKSFIFLSKREHKELFEITHAPTVDLVKSLI